MWTLWYFSIFKTPLGAVYCLMFGTLLYFLKYLEPKLHLQTGIKGAEIVSNEQNGCLSSLQIRSKGRVHVFHE